ncbi:MAG: Bug family tripartite tricarboxylate transporter substrate binding protein [Lautropia sp.]
MHDHSRAADSLARRSVLTALGAMAAGAALPARAQARRWEPAKPIRLINGFSAGGSADILCRLLADALHPILGQPVVVETRPGANGFIAAEAVSRSAPDGLTIGFATMSMLTVSPQLPGVTLPIDTRADLTPIGSMAGIHTLLVASPDAPFKTIPELIAYGRANPGKLNYASAGIGSFPHLAGELLGRKAGIEMVHVPYKGGAQAIVDVQAGRVHMLLGNMPDFLGQVKAGKLRGLAFAGDRVSPALPDLPLISRWLPDFNLSNWFGIVGPARMPEPVVATLSGAIRSVLEEPAIGKRLGELGAVPLPSTPDRFVGRIDADRRQWGDVIKAANIRV